MDVLLESLQDEWHGLLRLLPRLLIAVMIMAGALYLGRTVGRATRRLLERGALSVTHRYFLQRLVVWLIAIAALIIALNVLGLRSLATGLLAGGGFTAVVVGVAFREIGENLLAGTFLAFSRPFDVGDLIESEGLQGIVRGIGTYSTHIRTADGRDIFIPSAQIFNRPVINYTRDGLRRLSFMVGVDYADDCERARQILVETAAGCPGVIGEPPPGACIAGFGAQYVELEAFIWIDTFGAPAGSVDVRTVVMEQCRLALRTAGFTLSSEVTTNVAVDGGRPLHVNLEPAPAG